MKTEELKKTNEELQEEIKKNNEQIAVCDERTRIAKVNQFEVKAIVTLGFSMGFSMLPYLSLFALTGVLPKTVTITSITSSIPAESLPLIIAVSSLGVGTIGRIILEWKFKIKERFKSFTTAKSQSEKLQEEVKYAVELEKAKNRNKTIQQTMDPLTILNLLSSRYDINDKTLPQTREESQKRVEELSTLLKVKYDELDVLTTQKVLHEKFWIVRTKGQKVIDIMILGIIGGMISMFYLDMPYIMLRAFTYSSTSSSLISILTPLIVGIASISGCVVKRNKDYEKTFNILNSELGEKALPNKIKKAYEEQQDIDTKIESKIREISIARIQLQEQKRIMKSFTNDSAEKEKTLEPSVLKEYTIGETKEDTIFGHNPEDILTSMDKDIFAGAEREPQIEEKGPSLVLRRKSNNTQNTQK